MLGIEDELYHKCERRRKVAEAALEILWEKYRVYMDEAELTYPMMPEGFVISDSVGWTKAIQHSFS